MIRETFAAGAANRPRSFNETLRIREAEPGAAAGSRAAARPASPHANADMVRAGFERLRKAWRWLERKRTQQISSRRLRVAETISLGEKRSVSIVQVDGAQYLIGCSTASVQLLAVLERNDDKRDSGRRVMKFEGGS